MMPWLGEKGASLQWEAKASPAGEGTFCSGVEGESATTAFQLPRGPFHLRMLGRTGWFSSAQNCKDSTGGRALPPGAAAGEPRRAGNRRIALFGDASGCIPVVSAATQPKHHEPEDALSTCDTCKRHLGTRSAQ